MEKDENRTHTEIRCGERLKITITDGDYMLQEGIDYETYCSRGTNEMVWFMALEGIGKYENIFLRGYELIPSENNSWTQEDAESFREYFRSEIEKNGVSH